jgi:hypothetical protein
MVALIAHGRLAALAEPDELRRQATGGDVIEIETDRAFDGSSLEGQPLVRGVSQASPRAMRVVVQDASAATPPIVSAITKTGTNVVKAGEYRLTFDEVFAELVGRHERRVNEQESAEVAHERNEDDARALVERELESRRADAVTTPLDQEAEDRELAEARSRTATTGPGEDTPRASLDETQLTPAGSADVRPARTLDDQARNLPPGDDLDGLPPADARPSEEVMPADPEARMDVESGLRPPPDEDTPRAREAGR